MEVSELLAEFRREDLCQAVIDMWTYVSREQPRYENWTYISLELGLKSGRPTKNELIGYFEHRITLWKKVIGTNNLRRINQTNILIEDSTQVPIAIVLGLLPTDMLEQVAKKYGVDTSNDLSSGGLFSKIWNHESFRNLNNDSHWHTVSKLATFATEIPKEQEQPKEGIHSFCPDCKEDNPKEADHCMSCGRELPQITCPKCETANPPQAKFCMGCGEER